MHNFNEIYTRILGILGRFSDHRLLPYQRRRPKMSDLELVSLTLTAEYLGIDSESDLFRKLPCPMAHKIERSVFNRRRRRLLPYVEAIRSRLAEAFNEFEDIFLMDSMPLEVCRLSRSRRSTVCREAYPSSPDHGYCASQRMYFYGYKLHAVCSVKGVFHSIDISPASVHDIHYLKDVRGRLADCNPAGRQRVPVVQDPAGPVQHVQNKSSGTDEKKSEQLPQAAPCVQEEPQKDRDPLLSAM